MKRCAACLLGLVLLLAAIPALALEIRLHQQVEVAGDMVRLGEVGEIIGAEGGLQQALAPLELFAAPEPGGQRQISAAEIAQAFAQRASGLAEVQWSGAKTLNLKRAGQQFGPAQIETLIGQYLQANKARLPKARVHFRISQPPAPFTLPAGKLVSEVIPGDPGLLKSRSMTLIFRVDGRLVKTLLVRGELDVVTAVVTAAGDLERGTLLGEKDLQLVERDLGGLRDPFFDPAELLGKKLKRPLRAGDVLEPGMVDTPPLVKRGDVVNMQLRGSGFTLSAQGVARQDGGAGETILVRNSNSRKDISCQVTGPGLVAVEFAQ